MTELALVCDIGGTNARFALCNLHNGILSDVENYSGGDFDSLLTGFLLN